MKKVMQRACLSLLFTLFATGAASVERDLKGYADVVHKGSVIIEDNAVYLTSLKRTRTLRIYLPPSYDKNQSKRYPVLYMHDAQNLFDDKTSFVGEWGIDESLDAIAMKFGFELIVVGIDNHPQKRLNEYSAWPHEKYGEAEGHLYIKDVVNVIKPYVDSKFRTLTNRQNTAMLGSSMGSLITNYAAVKYSDVFGKAGLFSTSYWYAPDIYSFTIGNLPPKENKWYFLVGEKEGLDVVNDQNKMIALLAKNGFKAPNIRAKTDIEGEHNEKFWRREFSEAIIWLFNLDK
ncbi:alpha/beta hydrolase-fold protein [Psychrosphaera haliotis]|nr:alpha/beta hydrolase-fold protein [Psychrosphaera haliotis]